AQRSLFALLLLSLISWAWMRPDPLEAVLNVEKIVGLALDQGGVWGVAAIGALILLPMPFLSIALNSAETTNLTARGLAIFFAIRLLAILAGNFPVPLVGYGASPIIGYFIALAWSSRKN